MASRPLIGFATLALLAACGPPPPSASAWAAAGGPAPGAAVASGPDTAAAEAPSPAPPPVAAPRPVVPSVPEAPAGELSSYRGTFGAKRVVVRMTCGTTCAGYYVYEATGEAFDLREVSPGTLESVIGGGGHATVTGKLVLDTPPGNAALRGRFVTTGASPGSARVALTRIAASGHPVVVKRTLIDKSPLDARCVVKVESFELLGLRDPVMEWRINHALSPEFIARAHLQETDLAEAEKAEFDDSVRGAHIHCRIAMQPGGGCYLEATAKVVLLDDHLLSVALRSDDAAGEAHPDFVVAGATIDVTTGEVLDARELLAETTHEPSWSTLVSPTPALVKALAGQTVDLQYGTGGVATRSYAWSSWPWKSFYLTANGVALPPVVDEFHKPIRELVQAVSYAKLKKVLRMDGPAAYLWGGRSGRGASR